MKIYIASSFRNLNAVRLLTLILSKNGHVVEDWTRLAPPLPDTMPMHERRAMLDSNERGDIFDFCTGCCGSVDLVIYLGPAGQDAGGEVCVAWASGVPVWGLAGPLEKPGLIINGAVSRWFSSATELLAAINSSFIQRCRVCGCTHFDPCITASGPCWWSEPDLCSDCAGKEVLL